MKFLTACFTLSIASLLLLPAVGSAAAPSKSPTPKSSKPPAPPIQLVLNGKKLAPEVAPRNVGGNVIVPVRIIVEELGSKVTWDEKQRKVTVVKDETNIQLFIDKKNAKVGGKPFQLEAAPTIIEGSTMLPVRFVSEQLGVKVSWDERNKSVNLSTTEKGKDDKTPSKTEKPGEKETGSVPADGKPASSLEPGNTVKAGDKPDSGKNTGKENGASPLPGGTSPAGKTSPGKSGSGQLLACVPASGGMQSTSGGGASAAGGIQQAANGGTQAANGGNQPTSGVTQTANGGAEPANGSTQKTAGSAQAPNGAAQGATNGVEQPGYGAQQTTNGTQPPVAGKLETAGDKRATNGLVTVQAISLQGDTLTIKTSDCARKPSMFRLANPDRVVLDLPNAQLDPALMAKLNLQGEGTLPDKSEFVTQIRYSLFSKEASIVRIVLDLPQKGEFRLASVQQNGEITGKISFGKTRYRVFIDPGHGGKDNGASSLIKRHEKDFVLSLGQKVAALLEKEPKIEVTMTRSDDTFIELEERPNLANNADADLFVSIHANSAGKETVGGTETYYWTEQSLDFAKLMHMYLVEATGFPDRKVKQERFVVIKNSTMPAVLLEIGFLTNQSEEELMYQDAFQSKVAASIVAAIKKQLNLE
ncbi:N-acetylmuramoyl-L-alanine amidase [Paenibacillus sp. MZ04-78.2]|uniref:N-acetylmuramoyl-L-alanine amidase family protein n=1 Tax=Paenibacillus sp. MZ04-78.2 TaxID=2962034 RepID=UPI0020B86A8E|nr:N-acetylmuramoyl-L-alanine amidase family protein [Paenibacillus sp. MZ04-78.2]MCP3772402.1 N-acetylmuramoyl-L-alanine amidase [Paenibacillus sp. MZ04-78.2]